MGGGYNSFYPLSPQPSPVKGKGVYIGVSQVPQAREKSKDVLKNSNMRLCITTLCARLYALCVFILANYRESVS
jgi:hypothetical protein